MQLRFRITKHFHFALNLRSITARFDETLFVMLSVRHGLRIDFKPFEHAPCQSAFGVERN